MSALPPDVLGTVVQAAIQQNQQARTHDVAQSRQSEQSREMALRSERAQSAVEDTDNDTGVHADAGGTGGQGRGFSEAPPESPPDSDTGISVDDDGATHVDLEA